jgi:hypothetical protein
MTLASCPQRLVMETTRAGHYPLAPRKTWWRNWACGKPQGGGDIANRSSHKVIQKGLDFGSEQSVTGPAS